MVLLFPLWKSSFHDPILTIALRASDKKWKKTSILIMTKDLGVKYIFAKFVICAKLRTRGLRKDALKIYETS